MRTPRSLPPTFLAVLLASSALGQAELIVSGFTSGSVHRYLETGSASGTFGSVPGAQSSSYGPDGHLYVCAELIDQVLRFDGVTGAPLGPFVFDNPGTPLDETGGIDGPTAAIFGPDGHLYVASFDNDSIFQYDGTTGAFLSLFVTAGSGGLNGPDAGMAFHPNGNLLVPSFFSNQVLEYDGRTGAFVGVFVPAGLGGLSRPRVLRFRSDGVLYVTSSGTNRVIRYDLQGGFLSVFFQTSAPAGLLIHPLTGDVFVTNVNQDSVRRYDAAGVFQQLVVPAGSGLDAPTFVELLPDHALHVGRALPGNAGTTNSISVSGGTPGQTQFFLAGVSTLTTFFGGCAAPLGVANPIVIPFAVPASGSTVLLAPVAAGASGIPFAFQVAEPATCRVSNLVLQTLN